MPGEHLRKGLLDLTSGVCYWCMQRTNIYLTDEQQDRLRRRAEEEGMSKSKLIRRILDGALAITKTSASTEEIIRKTSGIWADRDEADLEEVRSWRLENPLDRLTP